MAKKNEPKTYTPEEIRGIRNRLGSHKNSLVAKIVNLAAGAVGFNSACDIRDAAVLLVTTCMVIDADGPLETSLALAEHRGRSTVPHLDQCGLGE